MDTEEALYVSISPKIYRTNKSNILMGQADLLAVLKKLYALKVLSRQKQDLKKRLHKLFISVIYNINLIQNKMPTPIVPQNIQRENIKDTTIKRDFSKYNDIEEELKLIQVKLRELNS